MVISICILLVFFSSAIFLLFQGILSKVFELLLKRSKSRVHSARGMRSPHPDIGLARISVCQLAFWSSNLFPPSTSMRNLLQHNVVTQISFLLELINIQQQTPQTNLPHRYSSPVKEMDASWRNFTLPALLFFVFLCGTLMALSFIVHFSTSHVLRTFDGQSHPGTHGTRIPRRGSFAKKA